MSRVCAIHRPPTNQRPQPLRNNHPKNTPKPSQQSRFLRDPQIAESLDESAASASTQPAGAPRPPNMAPAGGAGAAPNALDDVEGQISVYEAPSMELLDRKSIRAEGEFGGVVRGWCGGG